MRAIACLIFAALFTAPSITIAQSLPDPPPAISPLHSEQDPNGVNMTDGQKNVDMPVVLSVPAAPRLTFDKVQNSAPSLSGVIAHNAPDEDGTASWSVHSGGDTSESFRCDPIDVCSSVTSSGSMFRYAGRQFQQVGSGAVYDFTVRHSRSSGGTSTTEFRYAASVSYPDGEVISYTYEDGYDPQDPLLGLPPCVEGSPPNTDCRTYRRPTLIESRTGYYITIAYQYTGTDATNALWSAPSQAAIYDPSGTLIRRLVYGSDGSVTDYGASPTNVGGRVFATSNVVNGLGGQLETPVASVQLPTEGSAQLTVNPASNTDPTLSRVIGSVVRDGVTWNYNYANVMMYLTCTYTGSATIKYDSVTVTGQNGYSVTYAMHPASEFAGNGAGCANSGANLYHNVIKSSTDALGRMTSYNYDLRTGILYGITLPESNGVTVGNDQCGNLTSKTTLAKPGSGLANTSESAAYLPEGFPGNECPDVTYYRPTSSTDALGRVTNYTYNGLGQMTQELAPADSAGVRRETDVTYSTNAAGLSLKTLVRVCGGTSCTGNAESHTDYTYGSNSALPLTVVQKDEATGQTRTTTYSYDAAGRVLSVDGPLAGTGDAKYFRYDTYGRKTWEISEAAANGIRLAKVFTYRDSDDKVISAQTGTITSPTDTNLVLSEQTDTTYDSRRYPIREKTYKGATTYRVTDRSFLDRGLADCAAVRMNFAALPAATATGACSLGTAGSDGNDRITKNVYDNAGQLLKVQKALLTPRQQDYVTYAYTPNSKQQYVTDANGNKAQFKYDGLDRLQCWIFPSKTTAGTVSGDCITTGDYEKYTYDAASNRLTLRKRDASTLTYTYDNLSRLITKLVPSRADLTAAQRRSVYYTYDILSRQKSAKFDSFTGADGISNVYNGFGELTSTTSAMGTFSKTIGEAYDLSLNRKQITHPDGQVFTYNFDTAGRLTDLLEGTTTTLDHFAYNNDATLASRGESSGTTASSVAYTWDDLGRLKTQNDAFTASAASNVGWTFTINPASQIGIEARDNGTYSYTGLLTVNRPYAVNGLNQYTSAGSAAFCYDANGNLTADGTYAYKYDIENRLLEKHTQVGSTCPVTNYTGTLQANLLYDPLGRLFQTDKATNATTTKFLYDGDALVAEYDYLNTTLKARYVHGSNAGADDPLVWYTSSALTSKRYLHADHEGSIVAATNGAAAPTINKYDEYGTPQTDAATHTINQNAGRFQYTGQAWIDELGMYYYKARIYSPTLGRFMQTDPIGYKDQVNLYAYVGDDPVNHSDPTGLTCQDDGTACRTDTLNGDKGFRGKESYKNNPSAQDKVAKSDRGLQRAVNTLKANPAKQVSISIKYMATGSRIAQTATVTATYAQLADTLIHTPLDVDTLHQPPDNRAFGGTGFPITLFDHATTGSNFMLQRTLYHEAFHYHDNEAATQINDAGADFDSVHQRPYKGATSDMCRDGPDPC